MSYVPTRPPSPPPPPRRSKAGPIVLGALVAVLVTMLMPLSLVFFGDGLGFIGVSLVVGLGCLVLGVVLMFFEPTRFWGVGILIGFFAMLVIGAGACVVLLAAMSSSSGAMT